MGSSETGLYVISSEVRGHGRGHRALGRRKGARGRTGNEGRQRARKALQVRVRTGMYGMRATRRIYNIYV